MYMCIVVQYMYEYFVRAYSGMGGSSWLDWRGRGVLSRGAAVDWVAVHGSAKRRLLASTLRTR